MRGFANRSYKRLLVWLLVQRFVHTRGPDAAWTPRRTGATARMSVLCEAWWVGECGR